MEEKNNPKPEERQQKDNAIPRRTFIKGGVVFLAGLLGAKKIVDVFTSSKPELPKEALEIDNSILKLGQETELPLFSKGLWDVPDERIPYTTFPNGERVYFLPGKQSSYAISGSKEKDLIQLLKDPEANFEQVIGPDRSKKYKNGYCTINNVFQLDPDNPNNLFAITENEQHEQLPSGELNWQRFTASVGWAKSKDGGKTWEDGGQLIKGHETLPPEKIPSGLAVTGAGQPSSIIKDGYLYVYHIDWPAQIKVKHPYQIFLARSKVGKSGLEGDMEFWTKDGFKINAPAEEQMPVIKPPSSTDQNSQAALPSVTYNEALGQFLAVYETQFGFCITKSKDGTNWSDGEMILQFPQSQYPHHKGDVWYSYPTLISPSEDTDTKTNNKGYLVCSKGIWETTSHQPVVRSFSLK